LKRPLNGLLCATPKALCELRPPLGPNPAFSLVLRVEIANFELFDRNLLLHFFVPIHLIRNLHASSSLYPGLVMLKRLVNAFPEANCAAF
jgi:hypothetical protein